MALSDLAVFSEYAYLAKTEILRQQIELFNAASQNTLMLNIASNQGDYNEKAFWGKVSGGLTRRRNAYGSGAIAQKSFAHKKDISVKVAAGTYEIAIDPGKLKWIQQSPESEGTALGQQMATDAMADMLNTAIGAAYTALVQVAAVVTDETAASPSTAEWAKLVKATSKFGDRSGDIACWVAHSYVMNQLWQANLANAENLFNYGNINVVRDTFGRPIIVTDSARLINTTPTPDVYHTLGLVPGAVMIEENGDFDAAEQTSTGDENIKRTYQAEWSYNISVKGFAWDKANGGASPADAALFTSTNWDQYAADVKDLAGVILETE